MCNIYFTGIFAEKNVSSFCKNINVYAIFNDQSFNGTLTNGGISFEQLGPVVFLLTVPMCQTFFMRGSIISYVADV